jgi:hypothetical protein
MPIVLKSAAVGTSAHGCDVAGQRFNWGQLATLVEQIKDVETLRVLSNLVRQGAASRYCIPQFV